MAYFLQLRITPCVTSRHGGFASSTAMDYKFSECASTSQIQIGDQNRLKASAGITGQEGAWPMEIAGVWLIGR